MDKLILELPNGAKLKAFLSKDEGWQSTDINIIYSDGTEEVLCAADYDNELGLRVIGMHPDKDDYEYCQPYPTQKRAVRITDETDDDGTWDVDVYDGDDRDDDLCIARLPSVVSAIDEAMKMMQRRTDIRWDILSPAELVATADNTKRSRSM